MKTEADMKSQLAATGKVLVVGLDGATFELIRPWAAQGKLPAMARLLAEGAYGQLVSNVPQSPPAWTSFMTGKNPGKHGIYEFTQPRRGTYDFDLVNGSLRRARSLWRILSDRGRTVGLMNVPMTFPPEEVNGFLISGFDTPYGNLDYTYPPELGEEVRQRFGDYVFFPLISDNRLRQVGQNFQETIDLRDRIVRFLRERYAPDFFMIVFNATDSMAHLCLHNYKAQSPQLELLFEIYQRLDAFLADLLADLSDDTTLVVMSDHGTGPLYGYLHLDNWLYKHDLLKYADAKDASKPKLGQRVLRDVVGWGMAVARAALPSAVKRRLKERFGGFHTGLEGMLTPPSLDWVQTKAYSGTSQGIYINLKGRQPEGIVEPGTEYEALREEIGQALLEISDPETGDPLVDKVYRKEDLFSGPYTDIAPDLYIRWRDDAYLAWSDDAAPHDILFKRPHLLGMDELVSSRTRSVSVGCHRREGILLLYGPEITAGREIESANLIDLAPTILHLMGEPVPMDMDGRVLTEALSESRDVVLVDVEEEALDFSGEEVYSDEDEEQVVERLRKLGYL